MEFKFIVVFAAVTSVVKAYPSAVVAPVAIAAKLSDSEFDPNPQYSFAYDVQDALTGDSKSHTETRNGGLVQGQYSVSDPDGTRRVVDYSADPINGFNAIVSKAPLVAAVASGSVISRNVAAPLVARTVVQAPVAAPLVAAAPAPAPIVAAVAPYATLPARLAAPLTYSSPLTFTSPYNPIARLSYISPYTVY